MARSAQLKSFTPDKIPAKPSAEESHKIIVARVRKKLSENQFVENTDAMELMLSIETDGDASWTCFKDLVARYIVISRKVAQGRYSDSDQAYASDMLSAIHTCITTTPNPKKFRTLLKTAYDQAQTDVHIQISPKSWATVLAEYKSLGLVR
ncbi:MAG: hypothetical protein EYC62_05605 [Alphaproteobacteria bacterium]|nr:MAG: hypothetical protein EYC62_05605 [Alphaproteobacteria bacterium]